MSCAKETKLITEEMFDAVFQQLINVIGSEPDASFLASLYKCFGDSARLFIHPSPNSQQPQFNFPPQYSQSLFKATQSQLHSIAQKRKQRASLSAYQRDEERDELAFLEEMEQFALEDMRKCIQLLEPNSQLLIAVGSVRELAIFGSSNDWPED
jgi:importin-5